MNKLTNHLESCYLEIGQEWPSSNIIEHRSLPYAFVMSVSMCINAAWKYIIVHLIVLVIIYSWRLAASCLSLAPPFSQSASQPVRQTSRQSDSHKLKEKQIEKKTSWK